MISALRIAPPMSAAAAATPAALNIPQAKALAPAATAATAFVPSTGAAPVVDALVGANAAPLFDFPGFAAGDKLKVERGSKALGFNVKGDARIDALTNDSANFWIKAGAFGISREAVVDVKQTGPTTASLNAQEKGKDPFPVDVNIVEQRQNFTKLMPVNGGEPATFEVNADGHIVVDYTDVRDNGQYHFILSKQN